MKGENVILEIHIDFMDTENLYNNLVGILGISKEEIDNFIDKYNEKDFYDRERITFNFLNEQFNFVIPEISISDITISFYHVTTNNNECKEILEHGLRDLQYVCTENTQFKRFINEHGIEIDISNNIIKHNDNVINYIPDYKFYSRFENENRPEGHLIFKLYKDQIVWGFREFKSLERYSCIHLYPEFLNNLYNAFKAPDLLSDWLEENNKAYLIKANVLLEKVDLCTFETVEEEVVLRLIELLFCRLIEGSPSESILLLKEGHFINPNEISEINEI
ncbi:hypothetical protein [Lysinibacillus sp. JNUCC 51]|uniref:hypothetical protein n=1 Tax=Lysinibacillus sp. JNUCC-51 TaxID=2792479 RepID=UPI001935C205|nr:hypothetical protein JNUCC51_00245 [Lysinibacillus sp. JNUCC-51]